MFHIYRSVTDLGLNNLGSRGLAIKDAPVPRNAEKNVILLKPSFSSSCFSSNLLPLKG